MVGGAGNDTYFVDNVGDIGARGPERGTDAVFSSIDYTLTANVETWCCRAPTTCRGTGNALDNTIFGNSGNNPLDGGGGADVLIGNAGDDTFVFNAGQADGDTSSISTAKAPERVTC